MIPPNEHLNFRSSLPLRAIVQTSTLSLALPGTRTKKKRDKKKREIKEGKKEKKNTKKHHHACLRPSGYQIPIHHRYIARARARRGGRGVLSSPCCREPASLLPRATRPSPSRARSRPRGCHSLSPAAGGFACRRCCLAARRRCPGRYRRRAIRQGASPGS